MFLEMAPAVSTCRTLIDSLHIICLVHGLEVRKPRNVIDSLISVTEHIIMDEPAVFLLFLQDMFPYLEKYLVTEYLPKVVARIEYVMGEIKYSDENTTLCDMALQVLSTYEALVLEYEGSHSFDYGVCELMHGVIALSTGNATEAENRLLSAESIIGDVMGCDNDYMKSVYQYLYYLYTRWNKSELAFKYEKKYMDSHTLLR